MTSLKGFKARARELLHCGRSVYSCSINGGVIGSSLLIRLVTCHGGEGTTYPDDISRKRRQGASDYGAHTHTEEENTLKRAVAELMERVSKGLVVSAYAYNDVLKWCANERDLESVKQVHDSVMESQLEQHADVVTMLLKCYIECGRLKTAEEIFNKLLKKNTVLWNMMIAGHAKRDQAERAVQLYKQMRNEGGRPDSVTYVSVLKACGSPTFLKCGEEIHAHIIRDGFQEDVRVSSSLVQMYAKCGSIEHARAVFNKMGRRNVVSWNVMIGELAAQGLGHEAFSLFLQMQREGFTPNAITYLSILNPCASSSALEWVKEIHAYATRTTPDVRVESALVQMYSKSGSIEDARAVFGKMGRRDVVSWNVMIRELAEHGLGHEAFSLFIQMQRERVTPNAITYLSILTPSSSSGALKWVKEVHAHASRAGPIFDLRVENALIQMYSKSGSIGDARAVFSNMTRRDIVSWNVMIGELAEQGLGHEAFSLFLQMGKEGFTPNAITCMSILNPCASKGALEWVKEVHAHALKTGPDVRVESALVQMYSKSGSIEDAKAVFLNMGRRDIVSWNVMIGELAEHGLGHEAFSLFIQMQREGFTPDAITFLSILNPCASSDALEWVKKVHSQATRAGPDVRVESALVRMYAKSGSIEDARAVFGKMGRRDVVSWNVMIGELAEQGLGHEAFTLFLQMQREGCTPDAITLLCILNPCSSSGAAEWVKKVHDHAMESGLVFDWKVTNAFVQMFSKAGLIGDAKRIFEKMWIRDVVSCVVMISGLAQHGQGREALQLFEKMKSEGVKPNEALFVVVLSACSHAGLVEEGRLLFDSMMGEYGVVPALEHYNCMVDLLGRAGRLKDAETFILNMPIKPDFVTWLALLGACRIHNNLQLAEVAAKECMELNPTEAAPYVLLSNVYAAVGNWDQVTRTRSMMKERGIRKEPGRCWIEVDGKVHQFQVGDTNHPETREIYTTLLSLSKNLKAGGYIPDTRLVLRDITEQDKEISVCSHSERLAIAYGLMHVPAGKPIRVYKNLRICTDCHTITKLISRYTGREIVARDANRFHHFKDGSCTCDDYW